MPLVQIRNLSVAFGQTVCVGRQAATGYMGIDLAIDANQTLGLVGESGSGKSLTALSIVRLLPTNAQVQGEILWQGGQAHGREDLLQASPVRLRQVRGREIACVFQDPMSSLNPVLTVGQQIAEPLHLHLGYSRKQARARVLELLHEVGLPDPARRINAYPHELSGGQQQRVMIAMAIAAEPRLLIADEPTTALDVTTQRQIIDLLCELQQRKRMSMLFITHDLGVVKSVAHQVAVMRHGLIREQGPTAQVLHQPQNAYTRTLLECRPKLDHNPVRLPVLGEWSNTVAHAGWPSAEKTPWFTAADMSPLLASENAPVVLEARALSKTFYKPQGLFKRLAWPAVEHLSFQLRRGQTLGVVGESGSGKTTLGLMLLGLIPPQSGMILFEGQDITHCAGAKRHALRRRIQMVFQNPYASLNPRLPIEQTLLEPMTIHQIGRNKGDRQKMAPEVLQKVGLDASALRKYPHEFSGGQRQRIAIARCLTLKPEVLILDEAVSALDVSVQAQVLNLLKDLQAELGLSYVFITHDLAVMRFMADHVLVMKQGKSIEQAGIEQLISSPQHAYTQSLLQAVF